MMAIVKRLDNYNGYRLIKEEKKLNLKVYLIKEEGQKHITFKFDVSSAKIPLFNLLCMIYETGLYHLWFPVCLQSFDVRTFPVHQIFSTCK